MNSFLFILSMAVLCFASTTWAANPRITKAHIEQGRAIFQGEADAAHELVLRIDDGTAKPPEWRSSGGGDFHYVVESSNTIPLDDGTFGTGIVAICTQGSSKATFNLAVGRCTLRSGSTSLNKDGVFTFADRHRKDGQTAPVSFRVQRLK